MAQYSRNEQSVPRSDIPESERALNRRADASAAPVTSIGDRALQDMARMVQAQLHATGVAIAIDTDGNMTCRARAGQAAPEVGTPVQRDRGVTGECVSTGAVICCNDTQSDPRVSAVACKELGIRSILLVPLLRRGQVAGVIEAFFPVRYGFEDRAVQLVESVAHDIVVRMWGEDEGPDDALVEPPARNAMLPREEEHTPKRIRAVPTEVEDEIVVEPPVESAAQLAADQTGFAGAWAEAELEAENANRWPLAADAATPWPPQRIVTVGAALALLALAGILYANYNGSPRTNSTDAAPIVTSDPATELRRTAEAGDAGAQYRLAQAYKNGSGVTADPQQATTWLQRAAENGNAEAQFELGRTLEGNEDSLVPAYTWYVVAGQSGKKESEEAIRRLTPSLSAAEIAQVRYNVGEKYANGKALRLDPIAAYFWFALSEWGGNADARSPMQKLESQLTPAQLREAKSRASTWIRRHSAPAAQRQNP